MNILLLSRYCRLGASSRVRSYQYLDYLHTKNIEIQASPLLGEEYIINLFAGNKRDHLTIFKAYMCRLNSLSLYHQYDMIWIERELFPEMPAWCESLLLRTKTPYIVDYDDAVFHHYDLSTNGFKRLLLSKKIDHVMRYAALVIVGNRYLAERANAAGAKWVEIIPSVVDLARFPVSPKQHKGAFTVGWIGSPVTSKYLSIVRNPLNDICMYDSGRFLLVGGNRGPFEGPGIEQRPWSEDTEVGDIEDMDVGIMPLVDDHFERGKCGYKLIQYMACWKPVVASPVGVNQEIVQHGVNGFLAKTEADWVRYLSLLRNDASLRLKMGNAGRKMVEEKYCLQVTAPKLLGLIRKVVNGKGESAGYLGGYD